MDSNSGIIRVSIGGPPTVVAPVFIDPVCHMQVEKEKAAASLTYEGTNYHFCHINCAVKFSRNPAHFTGGAETGTLNEASSKTEADGKIEAAAECGQEEATATSGAAFTCPMHPEVLTDRQMPCPLCGMALDPLEPTEETDDGELDDMLKRLRLAAAFTVPLAILGMKDMFLPLPALPWQALNYLLLALSAPVLWQGKPFFERALASLKTGAFNMFTLIGTGVSAAWGYSLFATLFPHLLPAADQHHGIATYFEPAAVIITLALFGQVLELKARKSTNAAISELLQMAPKQAHFLLLDDSEVEIDAKKVERGDRLRIKPGESVPVDAIVLSGSSSLDQSMLTGESLPVQKGEGDTIYGGTINGRGSLLVRAIHVGKETLLAQIISLVAQAQRSRAPIQTKVDQVAAYFVPLVFLISAATFLAWLVLTPPARDPLASALLSAVSVLIIACPCALGLATPMSIMVAIGRAARDGVLVKDAQTLEHLASIDTLVVDKTGTLTEGRFKVVQTRYLNQSVQAEKEGSASKAPALVPVPVTTPALALELAAALESASEHPLAGAIVAHAKSIRNEAAAHETTNRRLQAEAVEAEPGGGITGYVNVTTDGTGQNTAVQARYQVQAGSPDFIAARLKLSPSWFEEALQTAQAAAQTTAQTTAESDNTGAATPVVVAVDGSVQMVLFLMDSLKAESRQIVDEFKKSGVEVIMLTGDNEVVAGRIAEALHLSNWKAQVGPGDKYDFVKKLVESGKTVAVAGDGINDAPALALAQVGIAMGTGTGVAMESAGIVLLSGNLTGLLKARNLSRALAANIKQNLFLAFGYNTLAVPIAAGLLYPFTGLLLSPMLASLTMSLSSVSVIANALRLKQARL